MQENPRPKPGPAFSFIVTLSLALVLAACTARSDGDSHEHPAGDPATLGSVSFEVSCSPAVSPRFERAVAMLHSFWFEAADSAFTAIVAEDPACAMAHWGRSVVMMSNPMTRASPSPDNLREGLAAIERARELGANASHREQMYIEAALAYYADYSQHDHLARMANMERSLEALYKAHAEDMEAAIFYARTMVANASPTDMTFAKQLAAAEIMQPLFEKHPNHPGLAHYLIHAFDAPQLASRASDAARAYAGIAPSAPHALHMPSHIFTRLGMWDESIETNARSAQAEPVPDAAVHPMDYMVYAYLQQGRDTEAKQVLDRAVSNPDRYYGGLIGYNFAAMPARYALERNAWTEAAQLRIPVGAEPYVEAVTHFARAIGAARSEDLAAARRSVSELARLKGELDKAKNSYWAGVVEAQRLAAASWIAFGEKNTDAALKLASDAAELEATFEKHPVTPGPILPARELHGDMLMELGRFDEAQKAYEETLVREPKRARTLYGAARAAERAGNDSAAHAHYAQIVDLMARGDSSRAELMAARKHLDGARKGM